MKIISRIKGFVTNSSSANYWLDSGTLKIGDAQPSAVVPDSNLKGDLLIWLVFSIILIVLYFFKKSNNLKLMTKKIFDQKTIISLIIAAGTIFYIYINYNYSKIGFDGLFVGNSTGKFHYAIMILPVFLGAFFTFKLLKDNYLIQKIQNRRLAVAFLAILLVSLLCGRIFYKAGVDYNNTLNYLTGSWVINEPLEVLMNNIFVIDEQTDIKDYLNNIYNTAVKQSLILGGLIFFVAFLIILSLPRKEARTYFKKFRPAIILLFSFFVFAINYYIYAVSRTKYTKYADYLLTVPRGMEEPEKILAMSTHFSNVAYTKITVFSLVFFASVLLILLSLPKDSKEISK